MSRYIQRSEHHEYTFDGVTYPGVTGILRILDKSGPLMAWAAKQTAQAALALALDYDHERIHEAGFHEDTALDNLVATVGKDGAIAALTKRSDWQRDEAAALGTEVHAMAELVVQGKPTPAMGDTVRAYVLGYADWWQKSGWTVRAVEGLVVNPSVGYGGTFDLLARDNDGETVLADIKTGRAVYREAILQLAAYGMAETMETHETLYVMPAIDRYAIIHVTMDGVREIDVNIGDTDRAAFRSAVRLSRWADSQKGKQL